jgi:co-chaperonin GroES (HSP10)
MKAFGERIIVEKILEDNKVGGITVSTEKIFNNTVKVISLGEDVKSYLKSGDVVKVSENSGTVLNHEGKEYLVIVKQNILAKL